MDFKVIFKDTFLADLERIVGLIAAHNPVAALRLGTGYRILATRLRSPWLFRVERLMFDVGC
jgi:plasmid stabilization system protein ParE